MKRLFRGMKIAAWLLAIATFVGIAIGPSAGAATGMREELAHGDIASVTTTIQNKFSEFLTPKTGVLDWLQIVGEPAGSGNIARMTTLRAITPVAMVEGTAALLAKHMGDPSYTGSLRIASPDQGACLVGALVRGFASTYGIQLVQDERNTLQALVYLQFDIHEQQFTVEHAREALMNTTIWPKSVKGFEIGFVSDTPFKDCGFA